MTNLRPDIEQILAETDFVSTKSLRHLGFHSRDIAKAIDQGKAFKAGYGILMGIGIGSHPQIDNAILCQGTAGVIAFGTAAHYHHLCDALSGKREVIAPHNLTRHAKWWSEGATVLRTRDDKMLTIGIEEELVHGVLLRVTNPERTIIDLLRRTEKSSLAPDLRQHAMAALANYLSLQQDARPLQRMAEHWDARALIDPLIEIARQMQGGISP